jgi:hypothetical protein
MRVMDRVETGEPAPVRRSLVAITSPFRSMGASLVLLPPSLVVITIALPDADPLHDLRGDDAQLQVHPGQAAVREGGLEEEAAERERLRITAIAELLDNATEFKYYCSGVGLVREEYLRRAYREGRAWY